jgi:hypothetical protein
MTSTLRQQFMSTAAVIAVAIGLSACNTTKETTDTMVLFVSSTSPQDLFSQDGQIRQDQKINLFAGLAYENLRQEAAAGGGQYVNSLATLYGLPAAQHERFAQLLQANHSALFLSEIAQDRTAHLKMVEALNRVLVADAAFTR